ncbi:bifunctional D-glycero-beta-D-manno-heptose-7-phosphate kinase/D-glycero-beta-D-manno-heptose 1-phosphate adenylyltransferase HldE [Candidatus Endoriftia persephone]|jgi:D-beta-D-heptose 7-phosphate kinase/D-beta-D-heptose 1-phosphate adenosyltransferase|uniref:Bifunctional protein HldE n=3 Tax=Gammaproteobacteria TaxID=1236 RepID=G2FJ30_9GAMM|nr:bifunctional D-glycero-beta-D-manno-heptose-7-phosphate kinase/D-glycero-beta-D-manno-heptose 1-phosphate adenylyltransferase HldE [Candidatus Endoriftia persephone]EGW53174.1 bifunctional protein HldE [endosymbiont of Tevnia jerichonana (vent Tica)]USF87967.1 bifunctional D-glycero-beta-D-manno-heptose-7-phosphate kinase/D-glycero-beta-D-manno-heptose 1-phosphate adenylyltransferase HldE [Candidatus Endoriftia persephone]
MSIEIPSFEQARILVVGDVMLDRYWHGEAVRISPEAPVPVVRVGEEEQRPGGAGNVALNVAALGSNAMLAGIIGDDEPGRMLGDILDAAGVDCRFEYLDGLPTITKLRVVSRHQQLIRLDFEDDFPAAGSELLLEACRAVIEEVDLLLLSDYAKGTLQDIQGLIELARQHGKPVLVDPKQQDFSLYRGATLLTPNLAEFESVVGPCRDQEELVSKGQALIRQHDLQALLITRGEQGMSLLQRDLEPRHMPTHAREVFDVTGAGDTVISVLAAGLGAGLSLELATHISNVAAGVVVGKLGTASVTVDELKAAMLEHQATHRGVVNEDGLLRLIGLARIQGESIVVTNGCFDILHPGHVTYLEEASRLGDRLVVAVNVDETVRQLKGENRPVNGLEHRMHVLAALACVDWVVPFSEETPERLICRLKPDFLVKGGDNDPDKIPGAACTREAGGEVRVLSYVEGVSTTRIVESIRES